MSEKVEIEIKGKDSLTPAAKSAANSLKDLESKTHTHTEGINKLGSGYARMGGNINVAGMRLRIFGGILSGAAMGSAATAAAITGLAGALAFVATKAITMSAELEQANIAFTTFLGSADKAQDHLQELFRFAAVTPFEFPQMIQASRTMQAMGFAVEDVLPVLTAVGDAMSALGQSSQDITAVVYELGQMASQGRITGQEMRSIALRGVPVWKYLATAFNTTIGEIRESAEKGTLDVTKSIEAIIRGMALDPKFKGMMEKQSQTLVGLWSTVKDNVRGLMYSLGDEIVRALDIKSRLSGLISVLQGLTAIVQAEGLKGAWQELFSPETRNTIFLIAGAIAGALMPAMAGLVAMLYSMMGPLLPFMAAGVALAALAIIIAQNWEQNLGGLAQTFANVWGNITSLMQTIVNEIIPNFVNGFLAPFQTMGVNTSHIFETLFAWIVDAVANLIVWWAETWPKIAEVIGNVLETIGTFWQEHGEDIIRFVAAYWGQVSSVFGTALGAIGDVISVFLAVFSGDWEGAWNAIARLTRNIFNGIVDIIRTSLKAAVSFQRMILGALENIPGIGKWASDARDQLSTAEAMFDKGADAVKEWADVHISATNAAGDSYRKLMDDQARAYQSNERRAGILKWLDDLKLGVKDFKFALPDVGKMIDRLTKFGEMPPGAFPFPEDWTLKADFGTQGDAAVGAAAAGAAAKVKKLATAGMNLVDAFVALHPASRAVAYAIDLVKSKMDLLTIAIQINEDQLGAARAEYEGMQEALQRTRDQLTDAQDVLSGMGERLSQLKDKLSAANAQLDKLAQPRLAGMTQIENQIAALEKQLDRINLSRTMHVPLSKIIQQFPVLAAGMEAWLRKMPKGKTSLERMLEGLKLTQGLKFDEQLKALKEAAQPLPAELTFTEAMEGIKKTKLEIAGLTDQISAQEAAMKSQQAVIDSLNASIKTQESALKAQAAIVAELEKVSKLLNDQMKIYEDDLKGAEAKQKLVNDALKIAAEWFLTDRDKLIEMGGAAAEQAGVIDEKTRALLAATTAFAMDTTGSAKINLADLLSAYQLDIGSILLKIYELDTTVTTRHIIEHIDVYSSVGGSPIPATTETIPQALGGSGIVTRPTLFLAGERGPEAYWFGGSKGAPAGITVNVNAPIYGIANLEEVIISSIETAKRRGRI